MRTAKTDQTGRMPRLIWVFAGRTVILLVLSWGGSITCRAINEGYKTEKVRIFNNQHVCPLSCIQIHYEKERISEWTMMEQIFLTSVFIYFQLLKTSRRWNRDSANTRVDSAQKHLHQTGMWWNTRESILERNLTTVSIVGEALPRKEIWKLTNLHTCINSSTRCKREWFILLCHFSEKFLSVSSIVRLVKLEQ